ncbi:hypothetical protein H2200_005888 [Cladophialophora chaetospira]|uniref:Uncharacterized protein n=1 Tax=Cladophialophora chaetospira TaxID=386627 RepID=A0AA38XA37_9EURO|nr:hypothetical protein H2200_005888 [Cladophialophora chaetospira]
MPASYSDPPDEFSPSLPSRLARKVSNSVGSFKGRKHARFESSSGSDHPASQRSRRYSPKFPGNKTGHDGASLRRKSGIVTDGSHDSRRQTSDESVTALTNPFRRTRRSHTLETVQEVPSGQTSRRATVVNGDHEESELVQQATSQSSPPILHVQHSSACSDMHQSVKSGDYLLARGANPRTGVVTPAHSAGSSLDDHKATTRATSRPPRWRQKGDQWISLDLGEPTPTSGTPSTKQPEHQNQMLRTPQKLATAKEIVSLREPSLVLSTAAPNVPPKSEMTSNVGQSPTEKAISTSDNQGEIEPPSMQSKLRFDIPVKRKPVGSPPNPSVAEPSGHADDGSDDSTDTVLRKPRFRGNLRVTSAPDEVRGRLFNTSLANKELPKVPPELFPGRIQANPEEDPFLGPSRADQPATAPILKCFSTSGPSTTEKELPCLPTSNGQSQLKDQSPPYPISPTKEAGKHFEKHQHATVEVPRGPRVGGDPAYPYLRTPRPTYPMQPRTRSHHSIGERVMPAPVYDNPPKHQSPSIRTTGPTVDGPRSIRLPEMSVPERTRLALAPLLNTTTTHTGISMDGSNLPKPLQIGPRAKKPDQHVMIRGHRGFLQSQHQLAGSDITMNTAMNISTDTMMSIPMPRIRPRATTRPAMPTRAGGMYGVPKVHVRHDSFSTTGRGYQGLRLPEAINPSTTAEPPETGPILMRAPLNPRVHVHGNQELNPPKETPLDPDEAKSNSHGLMRRCSRCNQGFVGVKVRDIDSVIHTSDLPRDGAGRQEAIDLLHPCRSPLPRLPEEESKLPQDDVVPERAGTEERSEDEIDERDHSICCPRCCKLDCHEGCLGHPSPTPSISPTNSMWSKAPTPSVCSEGSTPGMEKDVSCEIKIEKTEDKVKVTGLDFVKSVLKFSKKDQMSNSGNHIQSALKKPPVTVSVQPPTPVKTSAADTQRRQADAVAAALSALKPPEADKRSEAIPAAVSAIVAAQRKDSGASPSVHKRQRSNSLPSPGWSVVSRQVSGNVEWARAVSGSSLRIPSPIGLALSCAAGKNGSARSRNVSGTSVNTIEVQIPNLASYTAVSEIVLVPFEATKMWINTHPQILSIGRDGVHRAWEMAQIIAKTAWRLWAFVFVYSKTGKLKFNAKKGETAGGFLMDVAKSLLYFLVFAAVTALVLRAVGLVLGVLRMGTWVFKTVLWVVGGILGLGAVK